MAVGKCTSSEIVELLEGKKETGTGTAVNIITHRYNGDST